MTNEDTAPVIMGVMIESNLVEGRQNIPPAGPSALRYGQSVTDGGSLLSSVLLALAMRNLHGTFCSLY